MGGDEEVAARADPQFFKRIYRLFADREVLEERIDDRVAADEDLLVRYALMHKVLPRRLRRRKQVIRSVVRQDAVDLLRHSPVVAPQAGLDVPNRDMEFHCGERSREHRVGVPLDENRTRLLVDQDPLDLAEHFSGLLPLQARPHVEVVPRLREVQLLKEDPVH
ncbi:hypothetical protein DSECCO2_481590 [anaerobic digester metagenome]